MAAADSPVDQLPQTLDATGGLVAGIRDDQWSAPTPCTDWTAREVLTHLVAGCRRFAAIASGEPQPAATAGDPLGADPPASYRAAAERLVAAFSRPGVLEKVVEVPIGTVPGVVALRLVTTEVMVHGWDLARATGQRPRFPEGVAEQLLAFTLGKLPDVPDVPDSRRPFRPPQPVADDAAAVDRLATCLGRPVTSTGSTGSVTSTGSITSTGNVTNTGNA